MSNTLRRYEIFLRPQLKDHQPITDKLILDTLRELKQHLEGISSENQMVRFFWQHEGQSYRDDLVHVFVDLPDTSENRRFFEEYKELLKARFRQLDIWMTTYLIEVL